jgi:glycine/D-amino acid oxidase-like deaminating enzyme
MTTFRTKNVTDLIAALRQVAAEHGSQHYVTIKGDPEYDDDQSVIVRDRDGREIAEIYVNCTDTDERLLKFTTPSPYASRKTRSRNS